MKNFFKPTKLKRMLILITTLIVALLGVVLGMTFYVSQDVKKTIEYSGGAEYVVKIETDRDSELNNNPANIANEVAESIYRRLDPLGVKDVQSNAEISDKQANVRVVYPEVSKNELADIGRIISEKPQLIFTDVYGNPLFDEYGKFNILLKNGDPGKFVGLNNKSINEFYHYDLEFPDKNNKLPSNVPLAAQPAKSNLRNDGVREVQIALESGNDVSKEWTAATSYVFSLKEKNHIYTWIDPHKYLARLKDVFAGEDQLIAAGNDLLKTVYVDNNPENAMRKMTIDASEYLISDAQVNAPLSGNNFILEGGFSAAEADHLAKKINYGVSKYDLKVISSEIIDPQYGSSAFNNAVIAACIVFALIALILIFNYGIFGILATFSMSLFLFATLAVYKLMGAQFSPASIAALIIGIGMSVDAIIIMFERFKNEVYAGSKLSQSFKVASKKSWTTIIDSNITTFIVAVVLFYFGTRSIIGLSITLMLTIIFTLIIMLYFTKFIAHTWIKMQYFEDKKWVYGIKPKLDNKVQNSLNKLDYVKNARWFALASAIMVLFAAIMFAIFAGIDKSFIGGFKLSQEFSGGTTLLITAKDQQSLDLEMVKNVLIANNFNPDDITSVSDGLIQLKTTEQFRGFIVLQEGIKAAIPTADNVVISNISQEVASQLVRDSLIAILIAMSLVVVYILIRFKWSYSISALVALSHDAIVVISFFIIFRLEISPIFVAAILSVIGYSINDTIVTFDRIREKMNAYHGKINKESIHKITNEAIKETLKRSLLTSFTTIISIIVLMSFGNATKITFNIAMLIGLVSGTYSSIFIASWLWKILELKRQQGIQKRIKNGFWNTSGIDEQTVIGINNITQK